MKKILKLILALIIIFLILELILYLFKDNHNVTYTIEHDDETYEINEIYKNKKYYFKITNKNNTYSLEINDEFFKQKEIIKEIYTYQKDDLTCIYPALQDKNQETNIICNDNGKTSSFVNYKQELSSFIEALENEGYQSNSWQKESNKTKKIGTLTAYTDNIPENTYIYIYKYDGFYTINNENLTNLNLFDNDTYLNRLGVQVGKYYVIPNYDQDYDYNELYRIDMTNNKIKTIELKKEISKDSYINGIVDEEIYLFDKDELVQYKINPKKKKVTEVGNQKDGVLYYNLEFEKDNVYDFRDEEKTFKTIDDYINKLEKNTTLNFIEKDEDSYYYQTENNDVYYYNTNNKVKVFLFNEEITDFKLVNDTIYYISEDTLYAYSFTNGLNRLLTYSELSFNPSNRLAIYTE